MITDLYDQIFNMGGHAREIWAGYGIALFIVALMLAAACGIRRGGGAK